MNTSRFPRVSRDDPSRSGECTDIPGFYGHPVGYKPRSRFVRLFVMCMKIKLYVIAGALLAIYFHSLFLTGVFHG